MFGSGDKHPFEQLLSAVPVSWEKALGLEEVHWYVPLKLFVITYCLPVQP